MLQELLKCLALSFLFAIDLEEIVINASMPFERVW